MDEFDHAAALAETERELSIAAVRRRALPAEDGDGVCRGCGAPIEPARRAVQRGAHRCVECQEALELRARRGW
ncbi:TraR/DksA C4-type zinc finger protein [Segnochrobactrum spirostomi]|uniref:TraR/DksA C4-type zinc finger protein n=1 Tax=Segnochrobactrum spirostomi TaxID=2608987 RepID=UPI001AD81850|nr:TraR/DksA C4-type zinc finger protein [Segnochrobactrum spirostomi]